MAQLRARRRFSKPFASNALGRGRSLRPSASLAAARAGGGPSESIPASSRQPVDGERGEQYEQVDDRVFERRSGGHVAGQADPGCILAIARDAPNAEQEAGSKESG